MTNKDLKEVRILMLGESGVGKTSLILSLVSEQFIDEDASFQIPSKLEPITIPAEVTLEKIPGLIIDYSSKEQNELDLTKEVEKANVICLVYDMSDDTSKEKLLSYWLPKINEIEESSHNGSIIASSMSMNGHLNEIANNSINNNLNNLNSKITKRPIILIANKLDKVNGPQLTRDSIISQLIVSNSQIETCIQCSAKTLKNVPEVFYYAQKSVLYPTAPIFDIEAKKLTPQATKCLTRIFKIVDQDNDGILNDNELNEFQLKCFGIRLNLASLQEVKSLLMNSNQNNSENLINNEMTLKGFLYLHTLFIKKGRHETTWTVLKKFGYDKNLTISRDYSSINLKVPPTCTVELSLKAFEFLHYLFKKYDKDNDGCLNESELADLFSICPIKIPWGKDVHNTVETDLNTNSITYCGFLSQWVLTTYFDVKTSMELLSYLGYNFNEENLTNAFNITRPKEIDINKKHTHRNVFLCYVYGRKKCGKTSFLQGMLGRDLQYQAMLNPEEITRWSCNLVQFQNIEKHLIMKEINSSDLDLHEVYPPDIVILLYDITDPNSFSFIADIFLLLKNVYKDKPTPCMIIGTKCDQIDLEQNYPMSVEKFAQHYRLPPPQYFSASTNFLLNSDIYAKIVAIVTYPKMYPMRSQLWKFFQKLGVATSSPLSSNGTKLFKLERNNLNPLTYFAYNNQRPKTAKDPESMFLRYTIFTAACITVAFFLMRLYKSK